MINKTETLLLTSLWTRFFCMFLIDHCCMASSDFLCVNVSIITLCATAVGSIDPFTVAPSLFVSFPAALPLVCGCVDGWVGCCCCEFVLTPEVDTSALLSSAVSSWAYHSRRGAFAFINAAWRATKLCLFGLIELPNCGGFAGMEGFAGDESFCVGGGGNDLAVGFAFWVVSWEVELSLFVCAGLSAVAGCGWWLWAGGEAWLGCESCESKPLSWQRLLSSECCCFLSATPTLTVSVRFVARSASVSWTWMFNCVSVFSVSTASKLCNSYSWWFCTTGAATPELLCCCIRVAESLLDAALIFCCCLVADESLFTGSPPLRDPLESLLESLRAVSVSPVSVRSLAVLRLDAAEPRNFERRKWDPPLAVLLLVMVLLCEASDEREWDRDLERYRLLSTPCKYIKCGINDGCLKRIKMLMHFKFEPWR